MGEDFTNLQNWLSCGQQNLFSYNNQSRVNLNRLTEDTHHLPSPEQPLPRDSSPVPGCASTRMACSGQASCPHPHPGESRDHRSLAVTVWSPWRAQSRAGNTPKLSPFHIESKHRARAGSWIAVLVAGPVSGSAGPRPGVWRPQGRVDDSSSSVQNFKDSWDAEETLRPYPSPFLC